MIIGSDFLSAFAATWDFRQQTLCLGSNIILLKDKRVNATQISLVKTDKQVQVPPNSVTYVSCKVQSKLRGDLMISPLDNADPFQDQPGVLAPSLLINKNRKRSKFLFMIKNETGQTFKIKKNATIAVAEKIGKFSSEDISEISCDIEEINNQVHPPSHPHETNSKNKLSRNYLQNKILILNTNLCSRICLNKTVTCLPTLTLT